ncbi:MAG: hypothetical protein IPL32_20120 [Chloracidobacterium sp.]|nr:hypothetical protein [Chloracidobacterium sp.]
MAIKRAKTAAVCDVPMVSEIFAPEDDATPKPETRPSTAARPSATNQTRPAQQTASSPAEQGTSLSDDEVTALRVDVNELLNLKFAGDVDEIAKYLNGRNVDVMLASALQAMKSALAAL